jgi:hypothetical protein
MPSQKIQRWIDILVVMLRGRFPASPKGLARDVPGYATGQNKAALRRTFERDRVHGGHFADYCGTLAIEHLVP